MSNPLLFKVFFIIVTVSAVLQGCRTMLPAPGFEGADFAVTGRLAVRGPKEGVSANFDWQQLGDRYEIALWGPLGMGRTLLEGDSAQLKITQGDQNTVVSEDLEAFMRAQLGWSVPLYVLPTWVQGSLPTTPAARAVERSTEGDLSAFEQHGWRVVLARYSDQDGGRRRGRLRLTRDDERITVLCNRWYTAAGENVSREVADGCAECAAVDGKAVDGN